MAGVTTVSKYGHRKVLLMEVVDASRDVKLVDVLKISCPDFEP